MISNPPLILVPLLSISILILSNLISLNFQSSKFPLCSISPSTASFVPALNPFPSKLISRSKPNPKLVLLGVKRLTPLISTGNLKILLAPVYSNFLASINFLPGLVSIFNSSKAIPGSVKSLFFSGVLVSVSLSVFAVDTAKVSSGFF